MKNVRSIWLRLGMLILVAFVLTGCLGVGTKTEDNSQDVAQVKALMEELESAEFQLGSAMEDEEGEFFAQLEAALEYFADSFEVSMAVRRFVVEVEISPQDIGMSMYLSRILTKEQLLSEDEEGPDEFSFPLLQTLSLLTDFSGGEILEDTVKEQWSSVSVPDDEDVMEEYLITSVELSEVVDHEPVLSVTGNRATWTKIYSIKATVATVDDQTLINEYSLALEVGLVKNSSWKINKVSASLEQNERLPLGSAGLIDIIGGGAM